MKYPDNHISFSLTPDSGVPPTPSAPTNTQVYARRGKNLPVYINSIQTM